MRNGEMILLIWQKGFSGIGDLYKFIREIGEKILKEETASQMLQSFMRMGNSPVLRHTGFKELFRFFYLPNAQSGGIVDLLLKKNRHGQDLRFKIEDFRFIIAKNLK